MLPVEGSMGRPKSPGEEHNIKIRCEPEQWKAFQAYCLLQHRNMGAQVVHWIATVTTTKETTDAA
jgi:hypothetical protein